LVLSLKFFWLWISSSDQIFYCFFFPVWSSLF
jgi:hypothetical protein